MNRVPAAASSSLMELPSMDVEPSSTNNHHNGASSSNGVSTSNNHKTEEVKMNLLDLLPGIPEGWPSEINTQECYGVPNIEVMKDKLTVRYTGKGNHAHDVGSVRSQHSCPTSVGVYYYEAKIVDAGLSGYGCYCICWKLPLVSCKHSMFFRSPPHTRFLHFFYCLLHILTPPHSSLFHTFYALFLQFIPGISPLGLLLFLFHSSNVSARWPSRFMFSVVPFLLSTL